MKELQPVNQNVLLDISEQDKEQKTASGIIIPDTVKEISFIAKVIGISNIDNAEVAVWDTVLYKNFSGTETEFDGKKYLVLPYAKILVKIVETDKI